MTTSSKVVTPVKTGVQGFRNMLKYLDSGFHRNDDFWVFSTFDESISVGRPVAGLDPSLMFERELPIRLHDRQIGFNPVEGREVIRLEPDDGMVLV